jgi:hypothetical protein
MKTLIFALATTTFVNFVYAGEIRSIQTTKVDPASSCQQLFEHLPNSLPKIKSIGKLQTERTDSCTEYSGDPPDDCVVHLLNFTDLKLTVISMKGRASPIEATVSSSKWNLLDDIKVGQSIETLEKHYGVKIPKNESPVVLMGECMPLTVWHANGLVTKYTLPCHACD